MKNLAGAMRLCRSAGVPLRIAGGEGPWNRGVRTVKPGVMIAGLNPVCTDAVSVAVMGYNPRADRGTKPFPHADNTMLLAEANGEYEEAIHRFGQAIDREDRNWSLYYLRARTEHKAGQNEAAHADLEEAKRLNPLETCLSEGFEGCE